MLKKCGKCGIERPLIEFHKDKGFKDGRKKRCRYCKTGKTQDELPPIQENVKPNHKICNKCRVEKPVSEFHKCRTGVYGVRGKCKTCKNKTGLMITYQKPKKVGNKICTKCRKELPLDNFHSHPQGRFGVRSICKPCASEYDANRTEVYRERRAFLGKKRRENNKDYVQKTIAYTKKRRKNDPLFRLADNTRKNIRLFLVRRGYKKKSNTEKILGCKYEGLLNHLNDNPYGFTYGDDELDVDHIIPMATANNEEDVLRLNHYTNFQLLPSNYNRYIKRNNPFDREHFEAWLLTKKNAS